MATQVDGAAVVATLVDAAAVVATLVDAAAVDATLVDAAAVVASANRWCNSTRCCSLLHRYSLLLKSQL